MLWQPRVSVEICVQDDIGSATILLNTGARMRQEGLAWLVNVPARFGPADAPEATGAADGNYWHRGDMAVTLDEVRSRLAEVLPRIEFHPGWIPDRFPEIANRRFALVHLDVDLQQPTADALSFFYQRLVDRGILICDDYGFDTCPGARAAMDTFFADKPEPVLHLPTGQGLVIRCAAPSPR